MTLDRRMFLGLTTASGALQTNTSNSSIAMRALSVGGRVYEYMIEVDTDITDAFQRLANQLSADGGGVIHLPPGSFRAKNLVLWHCVSLVGAGPSLTVLVDQGSKRALLTVIASNGTPFRRVEGISLWGLGADDRLQARDGTPFPNLKPNHVTGIRFEFKDTRTSSWPNFSDPFLFLSHITISNFRGNGVEIIGPAREVRFQSLISYSNGAHGFRISGSDHIIDQCTAYWNGGNGFYSTCSNTRFNSTKSFGNRKNGFHFDIGSTHLSLAQCEAQDNYEHGLFISQVNYISIASSFFSSNGAPWDSPFDVSNYLPKYDGVNILNSHYVRFAACFADDWKRRKLSAEKSATHVWQRYAVSADLSSTGVSGDLVATPQVFKLINRELQSLVIERAMPR